MRRAQPWKTNRARTLRANETVAEHALWKRLRNRQLAGLKFARQVPIGPYFTDLVCRDLKLIVEIDGATHATADEIAHDQAREAFLKSQGYRIFRVLNDDVHTNLAGVLETLLKYAEEIACPRSEE